MSEEDKVLAASMMDPGAGVLVDSDKVQPSTITSAHTDSETESKDYKENQDHKGKSIWIEIPTFEDQYKRFPETTRMVGPMVAVFDVANPEQLRGLNDLLAKQQPDSAPSIILASRKENFYEGKWLMLLEYFRVEYKQLVSTT